MTKQMHPRYTLIRHTRSSLKSGVNRELTPVKYRFL